MDFAMPVNISWDDEAPSIIRLDFSGDFTWSDAADSIQHIVEEAGKHAGRVDVIFTNSAGLPPGNALPHIHKAAGKLDKIPNLGSVVIVNPRKMPSFIRSIIEIVLRSYGAKASLQPKFVNRLEEARQRIVEDREQIVAV
jgi:hypothetical protein